MRLPLAERCERAHEWVSMRADRELSEIERALLAAHLDRCADCRAFAAGVEQTTSALRAAALEPVPESFHVWLPRRHSATRLAAPLAGVAAVLVAAAVGLSGGTGSHAPRVVASSESPNQMRAARRAELVAQGHPVPRNKAVF